MTTRLPHLIAALCLLVLPGCGAEDADGGQATAADSAAPPVAIEALSSPAGPGSAEPELAAGPDGFYLSWLERTGPETHALRFARLASDGWTEPRTVMERSGLFVNWADFPSMLVLEDGTMAAHWLEKSGSGTYAYDVRASVSTDGGETWGEDVIPHTDGLQAEHGFVSLFPLDGRAGAVWLDGRATVDGEPMTLRFATLGPDGASPDELLDESVCDCCQTSAAMAADGPIVVYRDRTEDEVRDIYAVRRVNGEWTEPRPVHEDDWVISACPVNGPAVAADGQRVAVAWFTGAPSPRVLVAFSDDAGATFDPPVRVDDGEAQGRVDIVLLDDGTALASWLERAAGGGEAEIRLRRVSPDGVGSVLRLADTSPERASGFPRMLRRGDELLFAWTEAGDPSHVRTARGRLTGDAPPKTSTTAAGGAS